MNLILLDAADVAGDGRVHLGDSRAVHLLRVVQVERGRSVRVGIIDGPVGTGTVVDVAADAVTLQCQFAELPPRPPVDLLLAVPRPKVLRRLWSQLAALGVDRIILTNAARVERNYFDTHVLTPECYRPLLVEGLQQARDTRLPKVSIHRQFKVLIEDHLEGLFPNGREGSGGRRLVADPAAKKGAADAVRAGVDERILLAVGPEGGWNDFEMALLEAHGFEACGMGARTLRSDTACVALLAIVHDAMRSSHPRV